MLPVGWLVLAVVLAVLLTMWITFTITRLDRLHARVDAAQAALDSQLVRRAAALSHVVETAAPTLSPAERDRYDSVAQTALDADVTHKARELVENAVGRAVAELADGSVTPVAAELREAAARVLIARRFYNDAVRDTRALRVRRMPRLLHLAGHRAMPDFFDIDDRLPPAADGNAGEAGVVGGIPRSGSHGVLDGAGEGRAGRAPVGDTPARLRDSGGSGARLVPPSPEPPPNREDPT